MSSTTSTVERAVITAPPRRGPHRRDGQGPAQRLEPQQPAVGRRGRRRDRQVRRERAAAPRGADHVQLAAEALERAPRVRQAEARPADGGLEPVRDLVELLEDAVELVRLDPEPGVLHVEAQPAGPVAVSAGLRDDREPHVTVLRELHRVGEQVAQHAGQQLGVGRQRPEGRRRDLEAHAVAQQRLGGAAQLVEQLAEVHLREGHLLVPRLRAGQVEQLVDEAQERVGAVLEEADLARLLDVERRAGQKRGEPEDRVHRRAQLVADVAQEPRLGLAGRGELPPALVQLRVERDDPRVGLLQLRRELTDRLLQLRDPSQRPRAVVVVLHEYLLVPGPPSGRASCSGPSSRPSSSGTTTTLASSRRTP